MTEKPKLKRDKETSSSSVTISVTPPVTSVSLLQKEKPRDIDRQRADFAWQNIQEVTSKASSDKKEYGSLARKMPTLIQINGLAQTLAFLKAKGKGHHFQIYNHLSYWFCYRFNLNKENGLMNYIINLDSKTYRLATTEALAFLQWLKRFAEAELPSEEDNNES